MDRLTNGQTKQFTGQVTPRSELQRQTPCKPHTQAAERAASSGIAAERQQATVLQQSDSHRERTGGAEQGRTKRQL